MTRFHMTFPFDRVIMLGDNTYGGQGPSDLVTKFAQPYKALLDMGVKFYASIGNHDDPVNVRYPLWNMGGERYYTYAAEDEIDAGSPDNKYYQVVRRRRKYLLLPGGHINLHA